jgi:hypothetical protein
MELLKQVFANKANLAMLGQAAGAGILFGAATGVFSGLMEQTQDNLTDLAVKHQWLLYNQDVRDELNGLRKLLEMNRSIKFLQELARAFSFLICLEHHADTGQSMPLHSNYEARMLLGVIERLCQRINAQPMYIPALSKDIELAIEALKTMASDMTHNISQSMSITMMQHCY